MARITPAEFLQRYDARDVGDLCGDDGVNIDRVALLTDTKLQTALDDASGAVDAALMTSGRYTSDDLTNLSGTSTSYLQRIEAEVALVYLWGRRPLYRVEERTQAEKIAKEKLDELRTGNNVLNIAASIEADQPSIDGPTSVTYDNLNLIRDRVQNYYPRRRLPYDR